MVLHISISVWVIKLSVYAMRADRCHRELNFSKITIGLWSPIIAPDVNNKYSIKIFWRRKRNLQVFPFIEVSQKHAPASQETNASLAGCHVDKLSLSLGRRFLCCVHCLVHLCLLIGPVWIVTLIIMCHTQRTWRKKNFTAVWIFCT